MTPERIELAKFAAKLKAGIEGDVWRRDLEALLHAARLEALEEAAKIADEIGDITSGHDHTDGYNIAAAIRERAKA